MTKRLTYRKVEGVVCLFVDIGCDSLEDAQRNRERIANPPQEELAWWRWYEHIVQVTPQGKTLPPGAPQ